MTVRVALFRCWKWILTYLITYSMEKSPSWEANWSAANQGIPRILWNPKVHHRTHKRTPHYTKTIRNFCVYIRYLINDIDKTQSYLLHFYTTFLLRVSVYCAPSSGRDYVFLTPNHLPFYTAVIYLSKDSICGKKYTGLIKCRVSFDLK